MRKLIDADELYAAFRRDIMGGLNYDRILREAKPVDAVPVVRCAVCRHFQCNMRGDGTLPQGVDEFECRKGRGGCDPMGFCDEGERKDGEHETD